MSCACKRNRVRSNQIPVTRYLVVFLVSGLWFLVSAQVGFLIEEARAEEPTRLAQETVLPGAAAVPKKVTLQFQGMDIVEILKILAEQAGFNLVAGRNVSGRVTLFIKEVDPWEALEVILASNELAYERRGQILTIMTTRDYELLYGQPYQDRRILRSIVPRYSKAADLSRALVQVKSNVGRIIADEATNTLILMDTPALVEQMIKLIKEMDQPVKTEIFSLNNATAKEILPALQEAITRGVGKVSSDERTNQVAVTDTPERLKEIGRLVAAFDERTLEVAIEAMIVQVTLTDKFQLGIDWQLLLDNNTVKGLGGTLEATAALPSYKIVHGDFRVLIEALGTFGDARTLSEPRLTVVNNQEAKILVGTREPFVTKAVSQTGTGTAVTSESVTFIDVGVKLFVTPTITRDGFVLMKVRPEVSSTGIPLTTSEGNKIPIVETTEAETVLLIEDGGTVMLGGLIKDEKTIDHVGIPILMRLPGLGRLFRTTKESTKKTELVVLLTPRIVTGRRPPLEVEEPKPAKPLFTEPDKEGYYTAIQDLVQRVVRVQSGIVPAKGRVVVQFTVTPAGRLLGAPLILEAPEEPLRDQAQQAVLVASTSFPQFPSHFGEEPRTFVVHLSYE